MKHQCIFYTFLIFLATSACEEKDAPILQGDIHGKVSMVDCYGFPVSDKSGIQVQLTGEGAELETTTDGYGQYIFQDISYGNYHISLIREDYSEETMNFSFGHIGGDAATLVSQAMREIPEYYYGIDSLTYSNNFCFAIFMHTIGATKAFYEYTNYYIHCFFSQSPDVSCENFEHNFVWMTSTHTALYYYFWSGYDNFLRDYTGTVYCRIYPQTYHDEIWSDAQGNPDPVYPETLGPPSEVFAFTVEGITRTDPGY